MRLAEDSGLDTRWFGGTHFRPQRAVMASPLIGASAASPMTSRISMGLAVQVLPLANPLRGAEEEAMVDHIGDGRLIFGVGRSSFIESYQGYKVDYGESRSLFFESLEFIQRTWSESPFSYHGEHYHFETLLWCRSHCKLLIPQYEYMCRVGRLSDWPVVWDFQYSVVIIRWMCQSARSFWGNTGSSETMLDYWS